VRQKGLRQGRLAPELIALCLYLASLGTLTLAPFNFTVRPLAYRTFATGGSSLADVVFNVLGFVPFGAILYRLMRPTGEYRPSQWAFTTGAAAAVSLAIEAGQLFLPGRKPAVADVLANTLGGALGFWLAHYLRQQSKMMGLIRYRRQLACCGLIGYASGLTGLLLWGAPPQTLDSWDPHYLFFIGNEATLNRPWLGKLFFVGLYDRVLTAAEVLAQFEAGPYIDPSLPRQERPIALYMFQEGGGTRVYDLSPVGPPLDLEIVEPHKAVWLPEGGLALLEPTHLHSGPRAEKIYRRLTETHTFSVVAWLEPYAAQQHGPARIVSLSLTPWLRNFTLAQESSELHFRVRTGVAGLNGNFGNLRTKGLELGPKLTHVVAIYDRGSEELYVDGNLVPGRVPWDGLTVIARALEFDPTSRWQRGLLVVLLLGPVGALAWAWRRQ
jgi:glycopeptide antibiotics resistance protein